MRKKGLLKIGEKMGFKWIYFPELIKLKDCSTLGKNIESVLTGKKDHIVIDLKKTEFIYSPIINIIISTWKIVNKTKGSLTIVNAKNGNYDKFVDGNINKIFPVFKDEKEFLNLLKK